MTWIDIVPEFTVAVLLILLPGLLVLSSWRFRPLVAIFAAAPVSAFIFTASATVVQFVGKVWSMWWVLGFTALMCCIGATRQLLFKTKTGWELWRTAGEWKKIGTYLLGIAIGAFFFLTPLLKALLSPNSFSQRYDNAFHLNGVHSVAVGDGASPFELQHIGAGLFYPAGWHEWAGLVAQLFSENGIRAVQVCTLAALLVVLPFSLAWCFESVLKATAFGRLTIGAIALTWTGLTFGLLHWGTLYPNLFASVMAPVALATGWDLLGIREEKQLSFWQNVTLFVFSIGGIFFAQPNAVFSVAAMLAIPAIWSVFMPGGAFSRVPKGTDFRCSRIWGILVLLAVVLLGAAWVKASSNTASVWEPEFSTWKAGAKAILGINQEFLPVLAVLLVIGYACLLLKPGRWVIGFSYLTMVFVYVVSAAFPDGSFRSIVAGLYYNDYRRPFAAIAFLALPIAAFGAQCVFNFVVKNLGKRLPKAVIAASAVALTFVIGFLSVHNGQVGFQVHWTTEAFKLNDRSVILSEDEYNLLNRLDEHVEPGATVVVNPWHGGGLVYAIADREPTTPYMVPHWSPAVKELNENLENVATDPAVCDAVRQEKAEYVLVLDPKNISEIALAENYEGLDEIPERQGFELVDREGDAGLYKITACEK